MKKRKKVQSSNYIVLLKKITQTVNNIDPFHLIDGGAPEDEYASEIQKILLCLSKINTKQELKAELITIFSDSFGENVAEKIIDILTSTIFGQVYDDE